MKSELQKSRFESKYKSCFEKGDEHEVNVKHDKEIRK